MNNSQKGKAFERWDRDGVAQHRNMMHEIAMKKQITMYQREEKILEKELREISKVKETLLQIRAPLRRRVRGAELQEDLVESSGTERNLRKTSEVTRKTNASRGPGVQQDGGNFKTMQTKAGNNGLTHKTSELSTKALDGKGQPSAALNIQHRKISTLERGLRYIPPGGKKLTKRNIAAPAFLAGKATVSEEDDRSGFLPVIKTQNPPPDVSLSVRRKSPLLERPSSAVKSGEHVEYHRSRSPALLTPLAPNRVDAAPFRAKSVPCEMPSYPIGASKGRQKQPDPEESTTLTMEETLRIKGKFRQIGHTVIATALLKGLRQKGQLSSEAIHNMHKPISLGEDSEATKMDENNATEGEEASKEQGKRSEESKQGNVKKSFKNIARKAIYVNRVINVKNNRKRSQSDTEKFTATANAINTRPRSVTNPTAKNKDKGTVQQAAGNSAQSKDSLNKGAGMRRRGSATEFQPDSNVNSTQEDTENANTHQTQQMLRKQNVDVDPFRPLMNPRTAHARRRKNTLIGDQMKELFEKSQNSSGEVEAQVTQTDDQTLGSKTVRFATDAWC